MKQIRSRNDTYEPFLRDDLFWHASRSIGFQGLLRDPSGNPSDGWKVEGLWRLIDQFQTDGHVVRAINGDVIVNDSRLRFPEIDVDKTMRLTIDTAEPIALDVMFIKINGIDSDFPILAQFLSKGPIEGMIKAIALAYQCED